MAMEARCYHGGENRTKMKELKYGRKDAIAYVILIISMAAIYCTRFIPLMSSLQLW
jgi:energy-coupling factor transport system permease protein